MNVYDYFEFGSVISFEVYPSTILGNAYDDVTVLGVFDKDTAKFWIDPDALHVNVYPTLPEGTPDDPSQYQYVKIKHLNGVVSVIGVPWIIPDTLTISQKGTLTITVANVGPQDKDRIVRALAANGYVTARVSLK